MLWNYYSIEINSNLKTKTALVHNWTKVVQNKSSFITDGHVVKHTDYNKYIIKKFLQRSSKFQGARLGFGRSRILK